MTKKAAVTGLIFAAMMAAVLVIGLNTIHSSAEKAQTEREKIYECIQINTDDSLWTISERYAKEYGCSTKEYVQTLRDMNQLTTDQILAGNHIIIVKYE